MGAILAIKARVLGFFLFKIGGKRASRPALPNGKQLPPFVNVDLGRFAATLPVFEQSVDLLKNSEVY